MRLTFRGGDPLPLPNGALPAPRGIRAGTTITAVDCRGFRIGANVLASAMTCPIAAPNVFRARMPDMMNGTCPAGTKHRFTMDPAVQMAMMNHGSIAEGYGNPPGAMGSPQQASVV